MHSDDGLDFVYARLKLALLDGRCAVFAIRVVRATGAVGKLA